MNNSCSTGKVLEWLPMSLSSRLASFWEGQLWQCKQIYGTASTGNRPRGLCLRLHAFTGVIGMKDLSEFPDGRPWFASHLRLMQLVYFPLLDSRQCLWLWKSWQVMNEFDSTSSRRPDITLQANFLNLIKKSKSAITWKNTLDLRLSKLRKSKRTA